MSDGGSDADRRRWTHKRAQFDHAIHSARLLGFIHRLASGEISSRDVTAALLQVNASNDQSQYVAETLAMKKEVRGIARQDFHPEVALFFTEASKLIPQLSDGLASQIMMLLGHAAQNDAYLDTVSNAVSELLADLDHPLNREARNYLRLLWDQMEATRKLKQTEALFPGSSMPPPSARDLRDSGKMHKASARHDQSPAPSPVAPTTDSVDDDSLNKTAKMDVATQAHLVAEAEAPSEQRPSPIVNGAGEASAAAHARSVPSTSKTIIGGMNAPSHLQQDHAAAHPVPSEPDRKATLTGPTYVAEPEPPHADVAGKSQPHDTLWDEQTNDFFNRSEAPQPESVPPEASRDSTHDSLHDSGRSARVAVPRHDPDVKLPTNSVPRWAVITAAVAVGAIVAAVVYVTREGEPESPEATPSAAASGSVPSATQSAHAPHAKAPAAQTHAVPAPPPPPPPPPPAESTSAEPARHTEPKHAAPVDKPTPPPVVRPAPARVAVDSPSVHTRAATKVEPATVPSSSPTHAATTEAQPRRSASVVTPPDVAKGMSPLDRILAELRIISPDPVGIEDKARELSRIIATSKRKDAFYIIDHLGPSVALDALGRDPALEESLRTFAISTLGRVALDDDDSRAVSAIFMLGEWAKSGGKGHQKAISALESIAKERIIKASAPRTKALHAAQAEIN